MSISQRETHLICFKIYIIYNSSFVPKTIFLHAWTSMTSLFNSQLVKFFLTLGDMACFHNLIMERGESHPVHTHLHIYMSVWCNRHGHTGEEEVWYFNACDQLNANWILESKFLYSCVCTVSYIFVHMDLPGFEHLTGFSVKSMQVLLMALHWGVWNNSLQNRAVNCNYCICLTVVLKAYDTKQECYIYMIKSTSHRRIL